MAVMIIDYGMSNLGSIKSSIEECGASAYISDNPGDFKNAERIILPGVGAFPDGMKNLRERKWIEPLKNEVLINKIPLLGICLGMQLLASFGFEVEKTEGLDFVKGNVVKFISQNGERIPHVGWNEIHKQKSSIIFEGLADKTDFYFVHSFHLSPYNNDDIIAFTPYCGNFVSAIEHQNIFGVQFHPEKSQKAGFRLLKNFLNY